MLIGAVNPYEFHARSIGVYAALTLADRVVTALPTDGAGDVSALGPEDVPRTLEAARAWSWSSALWREGVLTGGHEGASPLEDVASVCAEIEGVGAWAPIRPMVDGRLFEDPRARVEAIARDLKHGGINPGVTVPVSCGVSRFAGRLGLMLFRSPPGSMVTKIEASGTTALVRCAVPVLEGLDGAMVLEVREALAEPLARLRAALVETMETARSAGVEADDLRALERDLLQPAAGELEGAFRELRRPLVERVEDAGDRCRVRSVTLAIGHADPDGVLRAAATAARRMGSATGVNVREPAPALGRRAITVCAVGVRRLEAVGV